MQKGENAGYQHFLIFFHNVFKRPLLQGRERLGLFCKKVHCKLFVITLLYSCLNPLPVDKFFTLPNRMSLQTKISNLTKMEKKLSKEKENTVGKGEIARHEQFLLFQPCFRKACFPEASNGVIVWEWVKLTYMYKKGLKW